MLYSPTLEAGTVAAAAALAVEGVCGWLGVPAAGPSLPGEVMAIRMDVISGCE
jgi:hypothetical protein